MRTARSARSLLAAVFAILTIVLTAERRGEACTAFCAVGNGLVLVGNNEDWTIPRTKIWFVPSEPGRYGRMYVGFDDLYPQGGMNERGLWFDQFAVSAVRPNEPDLPRFHGNLIDEAMATCGTVDEVVRLFERYHRAFLTETVVMFADASGRAVSIEPDAIVRGAGRPFIQTNFHQSRPDSVRDARFLTASRMLDRAGTDISVDLFRRILDATHQSGGVETLYSNVYELRSRTMTLYYFHDFDRAVTFRLADELAKGAHVLDIPSLFPPNAEAEAFAARHPKDIGWGWVVSVPIALLLLAVAGMAFMWRRGGVAVRVGIGVLAAVMVGGAGTVAISARKPLPAPWVRFSIAPATGRSASIGAGSLRSTGVRLRSAVALAYDIPSVRVIGPDALNTRYAIDAVVDLDASDRFRSLLRQELDARFGLETHVEPRVFDALVLDGGDAARLPAGAGPTLQVSDTTVRAGSMTDLASGLEAVLSRPVIDTTGLDDFYDLHFDRDDAAMEAVARDLLSRYGLNLTPSRRTMDALLVDRVDPGPVLTFIGAAASVTRALPLPVSQRLAQILAIR